MNTVKTSTTVDFDKEALNEYFTAKFREMGVTPRKVAQLDRENIQEPEEFATTARLR